MLVPPTNGNVIVGVTTLGAMATYTCNPSYRLVGMDSRQCQENGQWSGEAPTCERNLQPIQYNPLYGHSYM